MNNTVINLTVLTMMMAASSFGQAQVKLEESELINPSVIRDALVRMSETDLKGMYLSCSDAASKRLLNMDEATACSAGAEELKDRVFLGKFEDALAWWRNHKNDEVKDLSEYFKK